MSVAAGDQNTAIGGVALKDVNSGEDNVAVGYGAGENLTNNSKNILIGRNAGANLAAGTDGCVAIGFSALDAAADSAHYTIAIGQHALGALTSGQGNVAIGFLAAANTIAGEKNTAIGYNALETANHADADNNTVVGYQAGVAIVSGNENVCIGSNAGDLLTTGKNSVILGHGADGSANNADAQLVLGHNCIGHGDNKFTFGSGAGNDRVHCTYTSGATFSHVSDERYKKDVKDTIDIGLDFINDLRTVTFKWKAKSEIDKDLPDYDETALEPKYDKKMYGLIAQEVKETLDKHNITDSSVWDIEETTGIQSISNDAFVFPLIKAVQELSEQVTELKKEIEELKN